MDKLRLVVEKRAVLGKQAKKLRREGYLPANIYGKSIVSQAVRVKLDEFRSVYKKAKGTHLVYLQIDKEELPVLIQNVQQHPVTGKYLHADFRKMDLKEKTEAQVPIEVVGQLEVVKSGEADLLVLSDKVWIRALPEKIPEKIVVDIAGLSGIGAEVRVKNLPKSVDYEFVDDAEKLVVQIVEAKKEEIPVAAPALTEEAPVAKEQNREIAQAEEKSKEKEDKENKKE